MRPLLLFVLVAEIGACTPSGPELAVTGVEVTNETELSLLEVEVHVFDADTDEWLGCAGADEGLVDVNDSDVFYQVDARPRDGSGFTLTDADLAGRNVYFEVIEDDVDPCPAPPDFGGGDDPIGTSGPLPGDALDGSYAFEDVVELDLAVQ